MREYCKAVKVFLRCTATLVKYKTLTQDRKVLQGGAQVLLVGSATLRDSELWKFTRRSEK